MCSDYKTRLVIKSNNSNNVIVSGYATIFNLVDTHGDAILKGAFKNIPPNQQLLSDGHNIKLLWQHDSAAPIGLIKEIFEDECGVQIEASKTASMNGVLQYRVLPRLNMLLGIDQ